MSFKVVIVTGAASGMGAAIALRFAKLDASVCITDINQKGLHKIGAQCQTLTKSKVLEVVADLRKDEDVENVVKCALKEFGKIDVLVNCAGIFAATNIQDSDIIEDFDNIFAVNLRGIVVMTKWAIPALIENKGCVINISSIGSSVVVKDALVYCMTKAGVKSFTECTALELGSLGVRVNSIAPGAVRTNIYKSYGATEDENDNFWKNLAESVPLKKCVKAEEIAELAVYLASDGAASITGAEFVMDAGMKLGLDRSAFSNLRVEGDIN